ncbi:MAG: signal peptidase I [Clostridia bacterium]|nr:signal peptidase I [Clostridia bacterium]
MRTSYTGVDLRETGAHGVSGVYEVVRALATAVLIVTVAVVFLFRSATVQGSSMYPTLEDGDRLVLASTVFRYERGDIVVVHRAGKEPLVKRIIALGGDTLDIDFERGTVTVNGEVQNEPYIAAPTHLEYSDGPVFPFTVPEGKVFVMGDNRNDSLDSRSSMVGLIDQNDILGTMLMDLNKTEAK